MRLRQVQHDASGHQQASEQHRQAEGAVTQRNRQRAWTSPIWYSPGV